jgi:hypothetical protein
MDNFRLGKGKGYSRKNQGSLCGWVLKVAELCEPLVKLLQKNIIAHDYVQADETTVKVLDEVGRDNRTKSYMCCYHGGGD